MTDGKREVDDARQELLRIDGQLLAALEKRAKLSRRIGELREGKPQLPLTERAQIAALVARASGDMPVEDLRVIFGRIYASCLALELPIVVAYAGAPGGSAYEAARSRFGSGGELIAADGIPAALAEVAAGRAEFAVIPIETHSEGLVQNSLETLLATELRIVYVVEIASDICLVSKTGNEADVERIYATAQDHAHASRYLAGKKASVVDVKSQAMACDLAAEDHGAAALCSETFGVERGLLVARRSVSDEGPDRTRFGIVGQRPSSRTGDDCTACVFSVNDAPGALLGVLKVFADRGINLKKIQSRPTPSAEWDYLFFLEVTGHPTDRPLVSAFEEIRQRARFFKVLGSYPTP
jgi:chorismate mutase/prephenate dehydratase